MSKNELEKIWNNTPALSWKEKINDIEEWMKEHHDGETIIWSQPEDKTKLIYPDCWKYKHSFGDGVYVREMRIKEGYLGFSAIHKHAYAFFLLSGTLASSKEDAVEEFIAPCYVISPRGTKRIVYAIEDCVIVTVHANPTNTKDLNEIEDANVVFSWKEYDEYLKSKENEKNN